jgi:hypothetical protein
MKHLRRFSLLVIVVVAIIAVGGGSAVPRAAAQVSSWQQIQIPPLPAFKPQGAFNYRTAW